MSVLVVLVLVSLAVMVAWVPPGELQILIHPKVVLDVLLHIDVTEARRYVRPVRLVVRVVMMLMLRMVRSGLSFPGLQGRHLARLLLGEGPLQHGARAGAAGRGRTVWRLVTGSWTTGWEELPVLKVVRRHQGLVGRHGGGGSSSVVRTGVARGGLGDGGQRGDVGWGHVGPDGRALVVLTIGLVTHQRGVGVVLVVVERRPRVAGEPVRSKVGRHARVGRHPGVQPDPLHHLGVLLGTELRPEAVWRRSSAVSNHVPVIVLGRTVGRPASFVKELVSQRRHSAGEL